MHNLFLIWEKDILPVISLLSDLVLHDHGDHSSFTWRRMSLQQEQLIVHNKDMVSYSPWPKDR